MYKNQKLVFSRRLTAAEVKKIEASFEEAPGIFITDVKTHSVEFICESENPNGNNKLINDVYRALGIANAIPVHGEGYVLVFPVSSRLQSEEMKNHMADKAKDLF